MNRRSTLTIASIIHLYTVEHWTCEKIGRRAGVTRGTIAVRLKKAGITSEQGEWVATKCGYCGVPIKVRRKRWKTTTKQYCHSTHYFADRENPAAIAWRHGTRLARSIVLQHFPLQSEHIVHHKDFDERNNDLANLAVFANQSDHLAFHHGKRKVAPRPIWDGATIRP